MSDQLLHARMAHLEASHNQLVDHVVTLSRTVKELTDVLQQAAQVDAGIIEATKALSERVAILQKAVAGSSGLPVMMAKGGLA